ncbi:hypothetical protein H5400_18055 [Rhodococcus wratislaviensis]|nr:hypothetical protein [Rhodococcus sp. 3A]MBC2894492.1 hypothetical protein [Rhodococcus sp. 4CII]
MDNPLHSIPEADRLEQDLPVDPAIGPSYPADRDADEDWCAPEADRLEQRQPVTTVDDALRSGEREAGWDAPEGDRLEQSVTVDYDDEDRDEFVDKAFEEDQH